MCITFPTKKGQQQPFQVNAYLSESLQLNKEVKLYEKDRDIGKKKKKYHLMTKYLDGIAEVVYG